MTAYTQTHSRSDQNTFAKQKAFAGFFRSMSDRISSWQARRHSVAHLAELNDHMLKDVGLYRYQIFDAVHGRDDFRKFGDDRRHPMEF